ncbi:MAG: cation:proton antiporter [Solobacterium sp.]|jgi:Kef-type K+ transport system membrane component KefB|nr:cation:proton antiporter [Solobacterium sp.]MCH4206568.1 cation:proton antiporter [Solobacterium sp.]MCH4228024.1 cation:proton antiporter [Solobacterium sp.]MCH4283443.1 cation:proton antiporter [Solobacterium sp.]
MMLYICRWILALIIAYAMGRLIVKVKMPSILGWLIAGMVLGPNAIGLLPQAFMDTSLYKVVVCWMQCGFGLMLGTELVWKRIKKYGRALMITTLTQSLGTFAFVSLVFGILFKFTGIPVYLAFAFGGIALATAPAPALSIVQEFHTHGPVTDTLLPMAVLDDVVGIAVFFTVNSIIAGIVSGGTVPLYMIPVMIFLPIAIGIIPGITAGYFIKRWHNKTQTLAVLLLGITVTMLMGLFFNTCVFSGITLNYMLMGVTFSACFSNMIPEDQLDELINWFQPILGVSLVIAIVDLGAPLDYRLILGAGLYTFVYIAARAFGKYFGARIGAKATGMPETVQKYLGLTLLPHSGVSLVFTGIVCSTLASAEPQLSAIVKGTIAAAAVINEIIAVIAAKKGFELADEINK